MKVITEDLRLEAANLVSQAIGLIDHIQDERVGYAPTYQNQLQRGLNATRKATVADLRRTARQAATLMRQAWDVLDPPL